MRGSSQELSIPQHELALICGLSRQRVNVAISEFKRQGLVRMKANPAEILACLAGDLNAQAACLRTVVFGARWAD